MLVVTDAESAAFGRLRVETILTWLMIVPTLSAAFGRLRVETAYSPSVTYPRCQPPSGGCVLKQGRAPTDRLIELSAAFGRLRVETLFG